MPSLNDFVRSPRFRLFADASLLTAGAFAACVAVGGGLVQLLMRAGNPVLDVLQGILGLVFTFAPLVVGPLVVWRSAGRRVNGAAVIGAFFGIAVTVLVLGVVVAVLLTVGRPLMGDEAPAALAVLSLFGAAMLVVFALSLADAFRDLRGGGETRRMDVYRIAAAVTVVVFVAVMTAVMVLFPGNEIIEALPVLIAFAIVGGMMTVGAGVVTGRGGQPASGDTKATA